MRKRFTGIVDELRERSVFRALVAYGVVAWMLLQVADVTFDRLPIPDSSMLVLIVLAVIGFPVTLILAWAYEITLRGVVRHDEAGPGLPRLAFVPFVAVVVVVSVSVGLLLYYLSQNYWEEPRRSIAVLPFTSGGSGDGTDYFSDGLTEEIRSFIERLNEFNVAHLSSSTQFQGAGLDAAAIARRLGAKAVLVGSVRKLNEKISVTARLIDGDDGKELWSEDYDRHLSDIVAIQEDIASEVARALHVVLPVSAEKRLKNLGSSNVEAYDLYLRGRDYLRRPADEVSLVQAEANLRQALALDPDFVNARAAMCQVRLRRYGLTRDASRFDTVEDACRGVLEYDSDNSEALIALGGLYLASGDDAKAMQAYETALEINSTSPDAYIGLARAQVALGQTDVAEASLRQAIDADVSYWASFQAMGNFLFRAGRYQEAADFFGMYVSRAKDDATALNNLGAAHYFAGEFERAAEAWDASLALAPTRGAYSNTGSMYFYLGDFEKAANRYTFAINLAPRDHRLWGNLADAYYFSDGMRQAADVAYEQAIMLGEARLGINAGESDTASDLALYYARTGARARAEELIESALQSAPADMYVHYNAALIFAQLGDLDAALDAVERAISLDYQRELLPIDPGLETLRDQPRFAKLVASRAEQRALKQ